MTAVPLFWLIALLLVAAAVAALVWPLLRSRPQRASASDGADIADVYRDQKRQLDREVAAGAMTPGERDAQVDELAARLGEELDTTSASAPIGERSPRAAYVTALILVAALPVCALLLYVTFGNPSALQATARGGAGESMSHEQIVAMVERLATRMKEHPEDPAGWRLLARAYAAMGRFPESVAAFTEAAKRSPEDASLLSDWADALAMQNQSLQGAPSELVKRALQLDPNHAKALSLAASAALERRDYDAAIADWRRLKMQFPPGGEETKEIDAMIAEAEAAKRGEAPVAGSTPGAAATPPTATTGSAAARDSSIVGRVSLDAKLRERASANDTVFIFARAVNGPRMPLALERTTVAALPREFRLDDSMAMTPAARLSNAAEVIVEARISKSGSATPTAGDLVGKSGPVAPGTRDVSVVIDEVVR